MKYYLCKGDVLTIKKGNIKSSFEVLKGTTYDEDNGLIRKGDLEPVILTDINKLSKWYRFLLWAGYDFGFGHVHIKGVK